MSKAKSIGLLVLVVVAVLITYFSTKYNIPSCVSEKEKEHTDVANKSEAIYRLPTAVQPVNYDLKIQPFLQPDDFHFNGSVLISVQCRTPTSTVQLHASGLEIPEQQVVIRTVNGDQIRLLRLKLKDDLLTLELDQSLKENASYTIFLPFRAPLTTSLGGFYRSRYFDSKANETRWDFKRATTLNQVA